MAAGAVPTMPEVRGPLVQLRASGPDDASDFVILVGGQVVHHDDAAWLQGREHQQLPVPVQHQGSLLLLRLDRDEPHRRPRAQGARAVSHCAGKSFTSRQCR